MQTGRGRNAADAREKANEPQNEAKTPMTSADQSGKLLPQVKIKTPTTSEHHRRNRSASQKNWSRIAWCRFNLQPPRSVRWGRYTNLIFNLRLFCWKIWQGFVDGFRSGCQVGPLGGSVCVNSDGCLLIGTHYGASL